MKQIPKKEELVKLREAGLSYPKIAKIYDIHEWTIWKIMNKERAKEAIKQWKKAHPEYSKLYMRKWYTEHPEEARQRGKKWRKANPERFKISQKKYQNSEKGKLASRLWIKKYRLDHPEKVKEWKRISYERKMKDHVYKERRFGDGWESMRLKALTRDNYICQVCRLNAQEVHHLDGTGSNRPEKEKNHKLNNLITVCHKCHIKLDLLRIGQTNFNKGNWKEDKERNKEIVRLCQTISQTQVSKLMDISRQRVNQIIKRELTSS